ncbi:unnamed protein product [Echinostoma caproni]|uniref:Dynein light chain n=1 Tax=Echinostoma caproni TaxID=27848 RepID=A0A183ATE8_9TREM|nr:unnamed protein product [Echinostoma caproni]
MVKTSDAVIYKTDMTSEMQEQAVVLTNRAITVYATDADVVAYLTDEFDKRYKPTWHCVMGTQFTRVRRETRFAGFPAASSFASFGPVSGSTELLEPSKLGQ